MPILLLTEALDQPLLKSPGPHIVLLLDQFPRVLGGGERVVLRLADLLTRNGYRVSIITFAVLCPPETLQGASCPVYLLPLSSAFRPASVRAAWQLGRFLRKQRVQVVQTFFESSNLFGGIVTKALSRAKLIWNRRDMGILRTRTHRKAYRLLRWLPDAVIAVSEQVRQHAIENDGIPANRVSVIYNGLDASLWQPAAGSLDEAACIITVGNIRAVKGHDVLVRAAADILSHYPDTQFIVAGETLEPDYVQAVRQLALDLGIANSIDFPGPVAHPATLLQAATLFVLPSRSEGFSNAIVEAMLSGLPVVATTVGGNAEAVVDGVTGRLVPPENATALAQAILALLQNRENARQMGAAGRARAEALFTNESTLKRMSAVFEQLLGNDPPKQRPIPSR